MSDNMIQEINFTQPILDRRFDFNKEDLTAIELTARLNKKLNEVIHFINNLNLLFDSKEDKDNLTNKRKLSPTGDFTGSLHGVPVDNVLYSVDNSADKITYLANQFSDGYTGLVIDGGFFEDDHIAKNYNGGLFR